MPLSPPPRDDAGEVIPHDHEGIADEHRVIRRISTEFVVPDPKAASGSKVSASMAFKASTDGNRGMSVDVESSILAAGVDARQFVTTPRFMGSVVIRVGFLRIESFKVGFDPLIDNPHHGEVWGVFRRRLQQKLLLAAEWFVEIPDVDLHPPSFP